MKSTELYTSDINIEGLTESRHAIYRYILLENEKEIECSGQIVKIPCFGIEIVREDINDDAVFFVEKDRIESITTYRYKAVQFLKKLHDNCVSPIHLIDVAGSIADEWISDFDEQLNNIAVQ